MQSKVISKYLVSIKLLPFVPKGFFFYIAQDVQDIVMTELSARKRQHKEPPVERNAQRCSIAALRLST